MEKENDDVRRRILAAAKELFVRQGYKKTTIVRSSKNPAS